MNKRANKPAASLHGEDSSRERTPNPQLPQRSIPVAATFWYLATLLCPAIALIAVAISLDSRDSLYILAGLLLYSSLWQIARERINRQDVSFVGLFAILSTFVFSARATYIGVYEDFSLIAVFGLPCTWSTVIHAMAWVVLGQLAFIFGASLLAIRLPRQIPISREYRLHARTEILTAIFWIALQLALALLMILFGPGQDKVAAEGRTESAYVYLFPMLMHGVNLFALVSLAIKAKQSRSVVLHLMLCASLLTILMDAYFLANMTTSRSFYVIGLVLSSVALITTYRGGIAYWMVLLLFVSYPLFKTLGTNRGLSSKEILIEVLSTPQSSYTEEGLHQAFGKPTDINMLDTFAASLNWEHRYRPYFLSCLYVFAHPIPRSIWPSKPKDGMLADVGYTFGIPYIGGIIASFNDDGGKVFMLLMMAFLGALIQWWDSLTSSITAPTLRVAVTSIFFLTTLLAVRALPFQIFFFFGVLFLPCSACYLCDLVLRKNLSRWVATNSSPILSG